jgi:hypothetical protein
MLNMTKSGTRFLRDQPLYHQQKSTLAKKIYNNNNKKKSNKKKSENQSKGDYLYYHIL